MTQPAASARPAASERERFLEALLESATDYAIIAMDLTGRVTSWNTGACRVFGWTEQDVAGQPGEIIFTAEDRAAGVPVAEMQAALRRGRGTDERWHVRKDGSCFWANGEMTPLRDETGAVQGFVKILRDRTAEREAAERQRADAEFLRSILAASGDCIKVLDLDANLIFMNEGGRRIMEVEDYEAIRGCPWPDFWPGEGRGHAEAAVAAAKAGRIGQFQGPAPTHAGTPRWWDVQVTAILGHEGRPERLLSVSRDITAGRDAEQALREARGLNTLVLESSRDCIVVLDLEGNTLFVSPGGIAAMDVTDVDATIGLSWLRVWTGAEHELACRAVAEARQGGIGRFQGYCPTHRGTPKWWDVLISPLPGPDGRPERLVSVGRDITELKQAEHQLALSQERLQAALATVREANDTLEHRIAAALTRHEEVVEALRQSQKMEAVGQLTGGIAHDFNNLLTGILGSLELLQARIAQGRTGELQRYVAAAQGAAERAASLTHRLLAFSRRQTLDPKPTAAERLVAGMEELIRRTVGPSVAVEVACEDGLWPTLCDANQLENALLNLCINARDAMPDGGRLTIAAGNVTLQGEAASRRDLVPGDYVALRVTDTGCGMPEPVAARAFDPFFTTKPLGQGTGLGLSMVYGFAKQSGGQVEIRSVPDHGTTVELHLPRHQPGPEAEPAPERPPPAPARHAPSTVLVVDDDATVRMLVVEVLHDLGYAALQAPDAQSALPILHSAAELDLLVTDVGLPGGLNGRQLADAARVWRPALKVLFITGYAEVAALSTRKSEAGMQVMTKPFQLEALAARIGAMMDGAPA